MAVSNVTFQATGDSYLFPITFPFLSPAYIEVEMARGVLQQDLDYIVDGANVRFLNYQPVGAVTIRRKTPINSLLVPFADGALLNARVMQSASSQALHGLEETRDYIDGVRDDLVANLTPADSPLIAAQLSGMELSLDNVSASVVSEQALRVSNDSAMAYVINQVSAATGGAQALQQTGGSYTASWTQAQSDYWSNLNAQVFTSGGSTIRAALTSEASTRASADSAMATNITSLTSRVGAAESAITTEQTTRTTQDAALSSLITSLTTRMGTAESAITTEQTTRASGDSANASSITALTTRMNGAESSITTEQTTRATETGALKAQYTVKLDVNGAVAGFGLASEGTVAGGTTSAFNIRADKFGITMPGLGTYTPFSVASSVVTFSGNTNWSSVQGSNKPLDNSGKVIDGGSGTGPGQRNKNDPPSYYPVGKTMQFKWGPDLGIAGGGWLTVETNKQYGDNSGGMMTQWAYGMNGLTWKRSGNPTDASWGAWTQDLDRNTYTGALNATYGADASNLNVGLGVNLLPNTEFSGGSISPAVMGWNPGGCTLSLRGDDVWRPKGGQALEMYQGARTGAAIGADVYPTGSWGDYHFAIAVTAGKRYEFSAKLAAHRCDSGLAIGFWAADGTFLLEAGTVWAVRKSGGPTFTANASGSGWDHCASFAYAPKAGENGYVKDAAFACLYWRKSDTDVTPATDSYAWLSQPFFGEALASQTGPSTYSPGYAKGAMSSIDKLTAANIATFMDNAVINNALIGNAAVGTLSIQGEAVTVPRSASTAAALSHSPVQTWQTIQSCYIDPQGGNATAIGIATVNKALLASFRILAPDGSTVVAATAVGCGTYNLNNGSFGGFVSASAALSGMCAQAGTYSLQMYASGLPKQGFQATGSEIPESSNRSLILISTKR